MKYQIQWLALVLAFAVGVAGSLGCATMAATAVVFSGDSVSKYQPVHSDEIVAIGYPDVALSRELGQAHAVAFIGLKNTYMLHVGGEELERISKLKLDSRRMTIDATWSNKLYLKGKQVWGEVTLTYGDGTAVSAGEQAELASANFKPVSKSSKATYQKAVRLEGMLYPAIKLPDGQLSRLPARRAINLYDPGDIIPPVLVTIAKTPLIAVGVAVDQALIPYTAYKLLLGLTAVVVVVFEAH